MGADSRRLMVTVSTGGELQLGSESLTRSLEAQKSNTTEASPTSRGMKMPRARCGNISNLGNKTVNLHRRPMNNVRARPVGMDAVGVGSKSALRDRALFRGLNQQAV